MTRHDGRSYDQLRPISIETGFQSNPEGSVLYRCGGTFVMVSASVDESVPPWMERKGHGWLTAEYAMHPRASRSRSRKGGRRSPQDGRSVEIQRLIGRSLRAGLDLEKLGLRTITLDCDVVDADGGTRTACISAGMVALALALDGLRQRGIVGPGVLRGMVGAVSAGIVEGHPRLDLDYPEDSAADVDLNLVATEAGGLIEVQGTAEGAPMPRAQLDALVDLGIAGVASIAQKQRDALEGVALDKLLP